MKPEELLREGKLDEAVEAAGERLRDNPSDVRGRIFLFELLCFRGEYDRAGKHLALLGKAGTDAAAGALFYAGALNAEKLRADMFERDDYPAPLRAEASRMVGTLNGHTFSSFTDSDPRVGPRLEMFAAGQYLWVPFAEIASLEVRGPERLRDLLWAPAFVHMISGKSRADIGEVLLPVLTPLTFRHPDGQVRLGRVTEWCADERGREFPYGQKMLLAGDEEVPFLEIRKLEFHQAEVAT